MHGFEAPGVDIYLDFCLSMGFLEELLVVKKGGALSLFSKFPVNLSGDSRGWGLEKWRVSESEASLSMSACTGFLWCSRS